MQELLISHVSINRSGSLLALVGFIESIAVDLTGVDSVSSVLTGESIAVNLTGVDSVSTVLTGLLVYVSQVSITRSGRYRRHSQCICYTYGHSEVGLEFPERHVHL